MSKLQKLSLSDQKILEKTVSGSKFKNLPEQKKVDLFSKSLFNICSIVGIKDMPDAPSIILLQQTFTERYITLTIEEFIYAFHLNFYNEYPERYEHFNSFDLNYMTKVLEAYTLRLREAYSNYKPAIPLENRLPENIPTDKEYYDSLIVFIEKNKQLPVAWNWIAVFNHMEDSGMITETDAEIKAFKAKVKHDVTTKAQLDKLKAADVIQRMNIDESIKDLSAIYKTEYVKLKCKTLNTAE